MGLVTPAAAKSLQSCPTLCMWNLSSLTRDKTRIPSTALQGRFLTAGPPRKSLFFLLTLLPPIYLVTKNSTVVALSFNGNRLCKTMTAFVQKFCFQKYLLLLHYVYIKALIAIMQTITNSLINLKTKFTY